MADIVAILTAQQDLDSFCKSFVGQLENDTNLRERVNKITRDYFERRDSPALLLYEEHLRNSLEDPSDIVAEVRRAQRLLARLIA